MNPIKELRKQKGLSQEELGNIINVQKSAISKYELGRAVPSSDVLIKLADFFGVTVDYLLGRGEAAAEGKGAELSEKKIDLASYINSRNELYYNGTTYKMDDQNKEKLSIAIQVALATMDKDKK